ncbi:MAG: hypothetical protein KGI38_06180 [Thaumarchaeota archaeon]|nr:hypothetical protein [Nitrososphaerota archaeon]
MTVTGLGTSTSYTLNIQQQIISAALADEYANSAGTEIQWGMTTNYQSSIDAKVSGGISVGFLGVDAAGQVGTTEGTSTTYTVDTKSTVAITYSSAIAWKVVDKNGNYMVYVQHFVTGSLSAPATSEYISVTQAITDAQNAGQNPYTTVGPSTSVTVTYSMTNTVTLDGQVSATAFAVTLTVHAGTVSGTSQTLSLILTNSATSGNNCYVHYVEGADAHLYLYKTGSSC